MPVYSRLKLDFLNFFLQETLSMYLKLASKIWCHFVSDLQRYDTLSAHVPKRVLWQFASEKLQYTGMALYKRLKLEKYSECFFMFGAISKATKSSFKKSMTFCRSIYVKKPMKLLAFIFEQSSYDTE